MIADKIAILSKHLDNIPPALVEGSIVAEQGPADENGMSKVSIRCIVVVGPRPDAEHASLLKKLA